MLFDLILQPQLLPPEGRFPAAQGSSKEAGSTSVAQQVIANEKLVSLIKTIPYMRYTQLPRSRKTKEKELMDYRMSSLIYFGNDQVMT